MAVISALERVELLPQHLGLRLAVWAGRPRLFSGFVGSLVRETQQVRADKNKVICESEIRK